jgi:hypothetical protein
LCLETGRKKAVTFLKKSNQKTFAKLGLGIFQHLVSTTQRGASPAHLLKAHHGRESGHPRLFSNTSINERPFETPQTQDESSSQFRSFVRSATRLFLRPDLSPECRRAQILSGMTEGHRAAARASASLTKSSTAAGW